MKKLGLDKFKKSIVDVVKEHPFSFASFMIFCITACLTCNYFDSLYRNDILDSIKITFGQWTFGLLLCEAIYLWKNNSRENYKLIGNVKEMIQYGLISIVSLGISFYASYNNSYFSLIDQDNNLSYKLLDVYLAITICMTLFFFYKNSRETSESYSAKAFCGVIKADFVYGVIAIGLVIIIFIFDELIFDTYKIELMLRLQYLALGIIGFPCTIMGLSHIPQKVSKFEKAMLSYVFTGLLTVAFAIIYIYIIKIVVTWTFPSNQVFSILTALFCGGIVIWTIAMGVCDENIKKIIRFLPFLFIPFVVLQIMSLSMRVADYGLTTSRYLGVALIVFEIIYLAIYTYSFIKQKDIVYLVLFVICLFAIGIMFAPGINMESAILHSQKSKIEKYLAAGESATEEVKKAAYAAYYEIYRDCGKKGEKYLASAISDEQKSDLESVGGTKLVSGWYRVQAEVDDTVVDVSGYSTLYQFNTYVSDDDFEDGIINTKEFEVYTNNRNKDEEHSFGTVDISGLVEDMLSLGVGSDSRPDSSSWNDDTEIKEELLSQRFTTSDGGVLIITEMEINGDVYKEGFTDYVYIRGYVLYK